VPLRVLILRILIAHIIYLHIIVLYPTALLQFAVDVSGIHRKSKAHIIYETLCTADNYIVFCPHNPSM